MRLTSSPTELTTAASDAAIAVLCLWLLVSLMRVPVRARWKKAIWGSVFALLAIGSVLGAIVHGLDLTASIRARLWQPLYLSLAWSVALFVVGGIGDWRGERAARAVLWWAVAVGVGFFALTQIPGSGFAAFIAYEAVAMVTTLVIYLSLWRSGRLTGAGRVALGIVLTLVAAGIQVSSLSMRIIWTFDHNGLFHLVQIVAILVIASGVRQGMHAAPGVTLRAATC